MVTSRNNRFSKGCNCRSLLVVAAILCGAYSAQAALPSGYTELQYFSMSGNGAANFIAGPALLVPEPTENGFIIFVR